MSFISERPVKAVRKRHHCEACDKWIEVGEAAVNWCGINDGQFDSVYYHPDCREAEVRYNQDYLDWRGGDDWSRLCEAEHDAFPWIKANHPIPYRRMLMSRTQWSTQGLHP